MGRVKGAIGRFGEEVAARHLAGAGLRIVDRNGGLAMRNEEAPGRSLQRSVELQGPWWFIEGARETRRVAQAPNDLASRSIIVRSGM